MTSDAEAGRQRFPGSYLGLCHVPMADTAMRWSVMFISIVISGMLITVSTELPHWILGLLLLTGMSMVVVRFDLLHPFTWFSPFFFLYSASVPILVWLEIREDIGSLHDTIFLEWIALAVFMLFVGPQQRELRFEGTISVHARITAWLLSVISLAVSGLYLWHIWQASLASKYEIALSTSILAKLDPAFSVFAIAYAVLVAGAFQRQRFPWALILFAVGWNTLSFLLSGERDLVFRIFWVTIFLYHALYREIPRWVLAILATSAIVLVPIMEDLKNLLLKETETSVIMSSMAVRVLNDEFLTASENLQYYLSRAAFEPFFLGETLLWDIKRALLPWFMVQEGPDPQRYFNVMFFPEVVERGGGKGFTLVGEGYMNFGWFGVVLWFAFLGWFVRALYVKALENKIWFLMYVVSMPLIVYIIRADFSNLLAQFVKHIAFPMLVIALGQEILRRRQPKA